MSFLKCIRLTTHRVVSDGDLGKVIAYTPKVFELCRVTYACGLMRMCVEFRDEILFRGGGGGGGGENVKPREKSNFMKNGKMVISLKIPNFSKSQMTKRTSPLQSSCEI